MRPRAIVCGLALLLVATSGCGSGGSDASSPAATAPSPTTAAPPSATTVPVVPGRPVGLIAIGHSGLTGENSDPSHPHRAALENSWATGTTPEVDSIYRRLVAAEPETEGHVANLAVGGAVASQLVLMFDLAVKSVPSPRLVIIQTIDNDIRCAPDDPDLVTSFGQEVAAVLADIRKTAPDAEILIVGQLGRPSVPYVEQLVAQVPSQKAALTGDDPCSFFAKDGTISPTGFATLTAIIDRYEAEQARVCAAVPRCHTDGGARKAYVDKIENFSDDYAHPNVEGNAAAASITWPVVAKILGID